MSPCASRHEPKDVVARLIEILSGDRPLAAADDVLDRGVVIHVDGADTHRGRGRWKRWVHLMRERGGLSGLRFEPAAMEVTADLVRVTFRWSGELRRGGERRRSPTINTVQYRVTDGRIVEIWTHTANYV